MQPRLGMAVACAYCSFENHCTAEGILRSIIHQLLVQHPEILPIVKEHYDEHRLHKTPLSLAKVVKMLNSVIGSIGETHIVVDGLDEISEDKERTTLLQVLQTLPARVLIFSRPLGIHLKHLPSATVFPIDAKEEDIERYVVSSLVNHLSLQESIRGADDPLVREVATKIRETSRGM